MTTLFFLTCFSFFLYFVSDEGYKKDHVEDVEHEDTNAVKKKPKQFMPESKVNENVEYVICLNNLYYDGSKFQKDLKKALRYNSARKANIVLYNIDEEYDEDELYLRRV